jgi:hypothetical protein
MSKGNAKVSFLDTLSFTDEVASEDPTQRARDMFMDKITDQLLMLEDPEWKGHGVEVRIKDENGNHVKDENGRYKKKKAFSKPKPWVEEAGNKVLMTPRFGASKLKLSEKGERIILDSTDHAIQTLKAMYAATKSGELDAPLMAIMNKRRRKS